MTKQIKIEELIPYMKEGWVACDKDGTWNYFSTKPCLGVFYTYWHFDEEYLFELKDNGEVEVGSYIRLSDCFDIAKVKNYKKSLIKIERK